MTSRLVARFFGYVTYTADKTPKIIPELERQIEELGRQHREKLDAARTTELKRKLEKEWDQRQQLANTHGNLGPQFERFDRFRLVHGAYLRGLGQGDATD
jgi:hypothetical protein